MAFANSINASNTDFELSSGTLQFAARDRYKRLPNIENIGIAYSGGTFTMQGADGTALSSTNPGYVILPSNGNKGRMIKYSITANQTFVDNAGSSTIAGNSFGVTTQSGTAYNQDLPFYLYAVSNAANGENAVAFMFSRYPNAKISPAAGKIAKSGSAVASTQGSFYCMPNVTVADYASSPCAMIGSFRMRSTTNVGDWTVQSLTLQDGIGLFQENVQFTQVAGSFGAASSNWLNSTAGTTPGLSGASQVFYIDPYIARCHVTFYGGNCNSSGVGSNQITHAMPYKMVDTGSQGQGYILNPGSSYFGLHGIGGGSNNLFSYTIIVPLASSYGLLVNTNFTSGASTNMVTNLDFQIQNS